MNLETWKDIPGFEGHYQASTLGQVRSIDRTVLRNGKPMKLKGKVLKPSPTEKGYLYVNLSIESKPKPHKVHRLVALTFLPNPDDKPAINHVNNDRIDNSVQNLEWCTNQENTNHAKAQNRLAGGSSPGEQHPMSKLTADTIRRIRKDFSAGHSGKYICEKYGVSPSHASRIKHGQSWGHI